MWRGDHLPASPCSPLLPTPPLRLPSPCAEALSMPIHPQQKRQGTQRSSLVDPLVCTQSITVPAETNTVRSTGCPFHTCEGGHTKRPAVTGSWVCTQTVTVPAETNTVWAAGCPFHICRGEGVRSEGHPPHSGLVLVGGWGACLGAGHCPRGGLWVTGGRGTATCTDLPPAA